MFARGLTTGVALATLVALASSAGVAAASASPRPAPGRDPGYSQVVPTSDGRPRRPGPVHAVLGGQRAEHRHRDRAVGQPLHAAGRGHRAHRGHAQRRRPVRPVHPGEGGELGRPALLDPGLGRRDRADDAAEGIRQRPGETRPDPVVDLRLVLRQLPVHQRPGRPGRPPHVRRRADAVRPDAARGHARYGSRSPTRRSRSRSTWPTSSRSRRPRRSRGARSRCCPTGRTRPARPTRRPPSRTRSTPAARQARRSTSRRATSSSPRT